MKKDMKRQIIQAISVVAVLLAVVLPASAQRGFRYPYVENVDGACYIVSRDDMGGVKTVNNIYDLSAEPARTTTPQHNQGQTLNNVASRLQIAPKASGGQAVTRAWDEAEAYCDQLTAAGHDDWRMPTQRELMLIYVLNDQIAPDLQLLTVRPGTQNDAIYYWSATEDATQQEATTTAWSVCFSSQLLELGGQTRGYEKTTENYIRCVRDAAE